MADEARQVRSEPTEKRVRAYFAGRLLLDTTRALLVWNLPRQVTYFVSQADVRAELLAPSDKHDDSPEGRIDYFDIVVDETVAENAAWCYPESDHVELRDHLCFSWNALDGWFEEDDEVFFHPRDPHHRVDICSSSRHIEVVVDGITVADSTHARLLFETNCATRYYLPLVDVRMDLLTPSNSSTRCPYKGVASYWSVRLEDKTYEDIVWSYKNPFYESLAIANRAAFYNEKMDIFVDGALDRASALRQKN